MSNNPLPDWNQWQALSRQYLDAWQGTARGSTPGTTAGNMPSMTQGFEEWARLFGGHGGVGAGTIDRVVDSVKSYAAFMQSVLDSIGSGAAPTGLPPQFSMPGFGAAAFGLPAFGGWDPAQVKAPAAFMQALAAMNTMQPSVDGLADATAELKSWINLPAFGLMREQQEHRQQTASAWLDYQQQMSRYNALMLKASQRGFENFQSKLASREEPGRQVDSLRGLYDLWVDAAEEGYAEVALSIEFREAYAALVNAQMRVRASVQKEAERVASGLGLPTRSEINSIGERLQALRREVRNGSGKTGDGNVERALAQLRSDVDALTSHRSRKKDGAAPAGARKKVQVAAETVSASASKAEKGKSRTPARKGKRKEASKRAGKRVAGDLPSPKKDKKAARGKRGSDERAVAAVAPGNFASRIARFADASLGSSRPRSDKPAKAAKSKKKR